MSESPKFSGACRYCDSSEIRLVDVPAAPRSAIMGRAIQCGICGARGPVGTTDDAAVIAYFSTDPVRQEASNLRLQITGLEHRIAGQRDILKDYQRFVDALPIGTLERMQDQLILHRADVNAQGGSTSDILLIDESLKAIHDALAVYP